jgi:hypothetical protein
VELASPHASPPFLRLDLFSPGTVVIGVDD